MNNNENIEFHIVAGTGDGNIPFSVGIDFKRQNLTFVDARFWRLKPNPTLKELKYNGP